MIKRVYIEITNTCNLRCSFCSFHHREPLALSLSSFERILQQVKPITPFIYLHVQGEPLLHPDFPGILSLCDQYEMKVQLVTNGSLLSRYQDELLSHPSLRKVSFSLQSIAFQKQDLNHFMETICSYCEAASKQGHPYTEIRFWREKEMDHPSVAFCLSYLKDRYTFSKTKKLDNYTILPNTYVDFNNSFQWPDVHDVENDTRGTCHGAIDQLAILSNGTVVPCCLDYDGNVAFGNIFQTDLDTILQTEKYQKMVEGFRKHFLTESYCRKCTFRLRFNKS